MTIQYTFSMIKPDVIKRNKIGQVNTYLENAGLKIVAQKMKFLTKYEAECFYDEHRARPFFNSLVEYITSGAVVLQVLKGEDAITLNRIIMGATNPAEAKEGTIRKDLGESIEANSIHGSDSENSAKREIKFFFSKSEIIE
ncbi:nucleoside-diphosphate kinase [Rickettsia typhi]|uniref:Nucleoside diphosphate kinase n=2 Tax=Rickettsia typhi TaxID=785 RepID=NDK_RICTY|nr:nucleoside-diphosphate kinase [Rickettsia typhi]Q68XS9.1 RecName: Full=Nucleoside diphosphate kinase; Short=NDK; Short=NDP kinase; AltName: Full=Nucleoside-2-P kinase [Rickettsia typhi str. Wilmington]AAU03563.1 NDK [Rickettsia typhi str. Wilmington]AFE53940.1 mulitfunctional nucleoside diphosphate kinase/apyrimidinic endonuclease/3'-phosphodiesterase [Rickettsia typhi str. TH1527]AFE54778.1 mulitfunctional nucleoside diphosphate kinase/apyrimidinic endonuclease/3'-phosphodiesterase [Rickett